MDFTTSSIIVTHIHFSILYTADIDISIPFLYVECQRLNNRVINRNEIAFKHFLVLNIELIQNSQLFFSNRKA